ncbi:MAG: putative phage abortive infection protein [Bacteroidales bacterium]|nr:putative phage abortive infection protein [Bacteroidales bacterium]
MNAKNKEIDVLSWVLIILAGCLAVVAFFSPLILTRGCTVDFSLAGQIGDMVGGISSPFIGLASIIVMFLAFYIQFKANKMMQKQFDRNKFENQFFQMLKTHKENSNMIIDRYKNTGINNAEGFAYLIKKTEIEYHGPFATYVCSNDELSVKKERFRNIYKRFIWEDSFGHYYRHLFLMVKFVVHNQELTYEEKRDYLRILRASLSTSEQVFLYYNWLSGYGGQWENDDNKFFTDYRMIHNVHSILSDFEVAKMDPFKELLEKGDYRKEKDKSGKKRKDDDLFEHQ